MDGSRFDTLARAIAQSGTRRRLVSLLLALPLGGVLATRGEDEAAAERPIERVRRRTPQRNRKQRNRKQRNSKNNNQNNNNNNTLQNTDKPCNAKKCPQGCCAGGNCVAGNSSAQCGTGGAACQACSGSTPLCVSGTCVCSGNSCGTCQTCTAQGTCQPVTNGTPCGTSSHGGTTLRCCNGTCPDPDCLPVGRNMMAARVRVVLMVRTAAAGSVQAFASAHHHLDASVPSTISQACAAAAITSARE